MAEVLKSVDGFENMSADFIGGLPNVEGYDDENIERDLFSDPNLISNIDHLVNKILILTGYRQN